MTATLEDLDDLQVAQSLLEQSEQAYFTFQPRADQHERFDQQTSFVESKAPGVIFLIGGNGAGTTECCMYKLSQFVLHTPPPRKDTPFWIIAGSYEQTMEACWVEKLYGHGHIPKSEVDWDRISWYKPNQNWPFRVPLKAWPGRPGRNWTLEFKSYEQGRAQMQARSLGGFCFVEQFPWGLLTEVLRGCREYNFPGSKMAEFTPVDPALTGEIEEMATNGPKPKPPAKPEPGLKYLPDGWEIWRANTECAMEAGHVNKAWFDEYFGMVADEMVATRMWGEFASYEGAIYQGFNPKIHLLPDSHEYFQNIPRGVQWRRSIDWGSGPENPLACLWGYRNGLGQWFITDEYYSADQNLTVMDHLDRINERQEWMPEPNFGVTWADPASPDCIRIACKQGFNVMPARNAVYEGIDYVRYLLKTVPGLNQPRLFINRDRCPNLARQMRTYRWRRGVMQGVNPVDARPEPLKKDDHAVDSLRYMVFSEATYDGSAPTSTKTPRDSRRHGVQL